METMQESKYKHGEDDEAGVLALAACVSHIFPMALDAAIQLDLFEIIARAGDGAQLSRSDIASQLPASNDGAAAVLDSLLRLLATHSLLTCSVSRLESGGIERRYGVAPAGKFFVGDENGVSFAQFGTFFLAGAKNLCFKDAILKGGNFSQRNNGKSYYDMTISNLTYSKKFNDAMRAHSTVLMRKVVKVYDGFASLDSIVDVGGGTGATLNIIIAKYPSIRGINFDLPHVLHNLSAYNGIEHISGDMFVEVPKGDAILLKYILHNWNDEKCNKLLKNCYKALPNKGKLIVMDYILPNRPQTNVHEKYACGMDMIMSTVLEGKERTEDEFETLATKAGFAEFKYILRNWDDEKCNKLLKNCYRALPNKGKLIVMDSILPNRPQIGVHEKYASGMDMIMSTVLEGKERTEYEFEILATKVGFAKFKVICYVYGMWIMEFIKSI